MPAIRLRSEIAGSRGAPIDPRLTDWSFVTSPKELDRVRYVEGAAALEDPSDADEFVLSPELRR